MAPLHSLVDGLRIKKCHQSEEGVTLKPWYLIYHSSNIKALKYTLTSVVWPSSMSLPFLSSKTLENGCSQINLPPCCHISLPYIMGCDIQVIHQRIQTPCSHASRYHHCHYGNLDKHYPNPLLSCIHVNTAYFLNITCTLIATSVDTREVRM